jgi:hypothetical protein
MRRRQPVFALEGAAERLLRLVADQVHKLRAPALWGIEARLKELYLRSVGAGDGADLHRPLPLGGILAPSVPNLLRADQSLRRRV